jgi:hypothetical protein
MTTSDRNPSARLEAIGQDERTGEWYRVFIIRDPHSSEKTVAVPFSAKVYRLRMVRHRVAAYAARAAVES